jgi:hemolysin III
MRRLDHAMIFLLIAGTYTPVGLLVLEGTLATVVLAVVWGGAMAGTVLEVAWTTAPRWPGSNTSPRARSDRRSIMVTPG